MLVRVLPCATGFIDRLNNALMSMGCPLSRTQRHFLAFVLCATILTERLCWATFERRSLGQYTSAALWWMFYKSTIAWHLLLRLSVSVIIESYHLTEGNLLLDDTGRNPCKKTSKISKTHKIKDKKTSGYVNGQELVFLVLQTPLVTIPVDFRLYMPDPDVTQWRKSCQELKTRGVPPSQRPRRPKPNSDFPTKQELALEMLREFHENFPGFIISGTLADALYGNAHFMDCASEVFGGTQVVSQLRWNQKAIHKGKEISLKTYFNRMEPGVEKTLVIRGGKEQKVTVLSARLKIKSHGKKRFIIALKYEGEKDYRYLAATDLSWRHDDIARLHTLRWLIEVFFEDWKLHEGWCNRALQQGDEGSKRGVILSVLCDHMLLLHPEQSARLEHKQPALTVGCLVEKLRMDALLEVIQTVVESENPKKEFERLTEAIKDYRPIRESSKHMVGRELGRQAPTPSLKYKLPEYCTLVHQKT
ncbi:transposase [Endozoicomonas gorgoniicola]|uniref:Transposase n=1 Tax=Endozoicomonas gorgoniicola TaxID=1234144 RepID=A0ABT3N442_9GAMM|nr:transposase [Endozoicomonas gorgoniicola]MCW7556391.1 transposase [Endozoicomonas gorgoniicola]